MGLRHGLVLVALAAALAGCGGGGSSSSGSGGGDAADLVPSDALAFATVDTDLGSTQLKNADAVLSKFPIRAKLLASIRQSAAKDGLDLNTLSSTVGHEVDFAVLKLADGVDAVGYAQPSDEQAFDKLLEKGSNPAVHEKISGWTVFSDKQAALDAVKQRTGKLSDEQPYKDATATVPGSGDAIARAYVAPAAIELGVKSLGKLGTIPGLDTLSRGSSAYAGSAAAQAQLSKIKWVAAAVTSHDDGYQLEVHVKSTGPHTGNNLSTSPADEIPSGSLLALAFNGGSSVSSTASQGALDQAQKLLGIDLRGLVQALSGETILYVRPGVPLPEVTLLAKGGDPVRAEATAAQLIRRLSGGAATPTPVDVDGVSMQKVALGSIDLLYGEFKGGLLVTDTQAAVTELKSSSGKLSSDATYKAAKDAAGMPDKTQGWLYVDLKDAVPAIEGFAQLGNARIPPDVDANLRPLRSLLVYGAADGGVQTFVAFLATS